MNGMERSRPKHGRRTPRFSRATKAKSKPAILSPEYLRDVARCEALPENQDGSDKSWVETARRQFRQHYENAKRAR
jgi:hypothetical protein